ncbi:NUDIX domain-containing protein [Paracoccus litorisediminis]|uniref:NUDIX domain-containing protein n=2 Tax=Paracoccus litorisediminis TaxID=2006130 RepID=A0A844HL35_9RHOB|nr:NUDIX hydrolase [Paracoccus litorisediminis]MTH58905.1 NUDIX domain-containing protein [Paracoccus litorisediminis]
MQVAALCLDGKGKILLVTSRGTGRWIVPKGWPMPGRTLADAAMQEAWEEAGVRGRVNQSSLGSYHYDKQQDHGFAIPVEVRVFALEVDELADDYPEKDDRKRRWYRPDRAAELVTESELKKLLRALPARLGHQA